jgi:hypothetical protein
MKISVWLISLMETNERKEKGKGERKEKRKLPKR